MITWKQDYSVKFEGIDEQHKVLISIIQEVEAAINAQSYHFKNLIEILNELDAYIKEHLSYEEALMKKHAYPDAANHMREHNELRYKILSVNFDNIEKSKDFYISTYQYLSDWLINHIMKTDRALGEFLETKEI